MVEAAIFGSVARGEAKAGSDLDILVKLPEKKMSLFEYIRMKNELTDELGVKVDLVNKDKIKPRLKPYIMKDLRYISI